jgi:hydrogenase maturation protease
MVDQAPPGSSQEALPLVIGVGNERRGDDATGLEVARALAPRLRGRAEVTECANDLTELLELWGGRDDVILVDGVRSGRPVGTVVRFEVGRQGLPTFPATSTHGFSLSEAVGLGQSLGRIPRRLVIYGIEVGDVRVREGLTEPVARAVDEAVSRIAKELNDPLMRTPEA